MFGIVPPHLLLKITKASDHSRHKVSPLEKHENALEERGHGRKQSGERGEKEKKKIHKPHQANAGYRVQDRELHFTFYIHVYGVTMRRENKPNAILIVSTFQHVANSVSETFKRADV